MAFTASEIISSPSIPKYQGKQQKAQYRLCAKQRHVASSSPEGARFIFTTINSQLSSGVASGLWMSPTSGTEAAWAQQGY